MAAVFCALLDYSSKDKRFHLYDLNLSYGQIVSYFNNKDISLVNRQPQQHFRAHFEVIIGKKAIECPAVSKLKLTWCKGLDEPVVCVDADVRSGLQNPQGSLRELRLHPSHPVHL